MTKYVINIDWMSVWCDFSSYVPNTLFEIKEMPYSTRQFRLIEEWYFLGELYATVQRVPCSSVLLPHDGVIKLVNRQLYVDNAFVDFLTRINRMFIKVKHISRLDICADFNYFESKVYPEDFIKRFLSGDVLHSGKAKFTVSGDHNQNNEFSYLRIGQKSSSIHAYLYNKTKEMKEVKFKHYIADMWRANKIDRDAKVWRLEFTMDSQATKILDKETGELRRLNVLDLENKTFIDSLFHSLMYNYFRFKYNDGTKNKSRMKDVVLLFGESGRYKIMRMSESNDAGKSEKVLVKQLYQFERERRNLSREEISAARTLVDVMMKSEYLREYVLKNAGSWENARPH